MHWLTVQLAGRESDPWLVYRFPHIPLSVCVALLMRRFLATQYWTETNIADGLTALTICIEVMYHSIRIHSNYLLYRILALDGILRSCDDVGVSLHRVQETKIGRAHV